MDSGMGYPELRVGLKRILCVDDDPMILNIAQRVLERQGYSVKTSSNGTDALGSFRQDPGGFDLVLTDLNMPGLRGDKLAAKITAIRPELPVILCTGFRDEITRERADEVGIRAVILKPVDIHELASAIKKVFDDSPSD